MSDDKMLGGPSPAEVVTAGSIASDAAPHADRYAELKAMLTQRREAIMAEVHAAIDKAEGR